MKKQFTLSILAILFLCVKMNAQDSCVTAFPMCTGTVYDFDTSTGFGAPSGPDYGCLGSAANTLWFSWKVGTSGSINITGSGLDFSSAPIDIDFIYWGPFPSLSGVCYAQMDAAHILGCDYSGSNIISISIPSAVSGEYYIAMISNYADAAGNINYSQTSGTGTATCTTTGLSASISTNDIVVYPNPASNGIIEISIENVSKSKYSSMQVTDILGRIIYKEELTDLSGNYKRTIDLTSYNKGIYIINVTGENHAISRKIIYN